MTKEKAAKEKGEQEEAEKRRKEEVPLTWTLSTKPKNDQNYRIQICHI